MKIGVPREIKNQEYRVGLLPAAVAELTRRGHQVSVETRAAAGIGIGDAAYQDAGAQIAADAAEIYASAELIIKVKEPQAAERAQLRAGQTLFTYLHLAADPEQARELLDSGVSAIAYETVTASQGGLPLLAPMSEVAGRMAVQAGAWCLQKANAGAGVLLGGVPGVAPARVVILGGGVVGSHAAQMAVGLGADVVVIDRSLPVLRTLDRQFEGRLRTLHANDVLIAEQVHKADLVIGAVLVPGAAAPKLVSAALVGKMQAGAALVDVAIDQGGCFATSRPTTHDNPIYRVDDVVHYCVANIPGAVPRTATQALGNATLPFVLALADKGLRDALADDVHLRAGLNVHAGKMTCEAVASSLGLDYLPIDGVLG